MQKEGEDVPLRVKDGILGREECLSAKRSEAPRFGWVTPKSPLLLILRSSRIIWLERKTGGRSRRNTKSSGDSLKSIENP